MNAALRRIEQAPRQMLAGIAGADSDALPSELAQKAAAENGRLSLTLTRSKAGFKISDIKGAVVVGMPIDGQSKCGAGMHHVFVWK